MRTLIVEADGFDVTLAVAAVITFSCITAVLVGALAAAGRADDRLAAMPQSAGPVGVPSAQHSPAPTGPDQRLGSAEPPSTATHRSGNRADAPAAKTGASPLPPRRQR